MKIILKIFPRNFLIRISYYLIPVLKIVGFPVAVFDAYDEILPHVIFKTKKKGGKGGSDKGSGGGGDKGSGGGDKPPPPPPPIAPKPAEAPAEASSPKLSEVASVQAANERAPKTPPQLE